MYHVLLCIMTPLDKAAGSHVEVRCNALAEGSHQTSSSHIDTGRVTDLNKQLDFAHITIRSPNPDVEVVSLHRELSNAVQPQCNWPASDYLHYRLIC